MTEKIPKSKYVLDDESIDEELIDEEELIEEPETLTYKELREKKKVLKEEQEEAKNVLKEEIRKSVLKFLGRGKVMSKRDLTHLLINDGFEEYYFKIDGSTVTWRIWIEDQLMREEVFTGCSGQTSWDYIFLYQSHINAFSECESLYIDDIAVATPSYTGFVDDGNGNDRIGPLGGGGSENTEALCANGSDDDNDSLIDCDDPDCIHCLRERCRYIDVLPKQERHTYF